MRSLDDTTSELLDLASTHFEKPRDSLEPDADLFETLGIDSMQALELLTRLENHFGVELPVGEWRWYRDAQVTCASRARLARLVRTAPTPLQARRAVGLSTISGSARHRASVAGCGTSHAWGSPAN